MTVARKPEPGAQAPAAPRAAIALDLDGTLVDKRGRIHSADVDILQREQRVIFIPATGRALPSVRRTFAKNGLFGGIPLPLPLVLHNGAALYGPGEVLQSYRSLPPEIQDALLAVAQAHSDVTTFLFVVDGLFTVWPSTYAEQMAVRFDLEPQPLTGSNLSSGISKLMCISADPRSLAALVADLDALPVVPAYSMPTVLEINLAGINKGDGAVALLDALGWGHIPLVAAGDGENDLELFDRAGQVFAPADSPPEIRARADRLIDIDRTGLLAPILEHIL